MVLSILDVLAHSISNGYFYPYADAQLSHGLEHESARTNCTSECEWSKPSVQSASGMGNGLSLLPSTTLSRVAVSGPRAIRASFCDRDGLRYFAFGGDLWRMKKIKRVK